MHDESGNIPIEVDDNDQESEAVVCPKCVVENDPDAAFCHQCGAPIGLVAALDPIQSILAEGFVYRQAVEGPPKGIILLGMWLLFLPPMLTVLLGMTYTASIHWGATTDALFGILIPLYGVACAIILYRTTANYVLRRKETYPGEPSNGTGGT